MGGHVLVVDDDIALGQTVARLLTAEGYTVEIAIDGESALRSVSRCRPDVILLDVLMPKMNGRQVLETLRADEVTQDIPVLVMTGIAGIEINRSVVVAADDIVEKPFDVDVLLNKLALALYRSQESGVHNVRALNRVRALKSS